MSNFYEELDVESVLQCPVCYELPTDVIYLCKVGHHMCDKCRKRLTTCPTCQSALTSSRNFLAEALILKFSIFKGGAGDGSNNNFSLTTSESAVAVKHQSAVAVKHLQDNKNQMKPLNLAPGNFKCLLESCRNRKEMGAGILFPHIDSVHSHIYDKFQNMIATFSHNFENFCLMKGKRNYHRAFHISNMGLFFLNLEVLEDKYINCWLSIPAPVKRSNVFDYEIEFSTEEDENKLNFVNKVASTIQDLEWLLKRGKVFVIPPTFHKLQNGQFFSLWLKIVYKSPVSST